MLKVRIFSTFQGGIKEGRSTPTFVMYTSIPSLAITAASNILASIPPVVSCAATDISTALHSRYLTLIYSYNKVLGAIQSGHQFHESLALTAAPSLGTFGIK
jgi:hypothetical protein